MKTEGLFFFYKIYIRNATNKFTYPINYDPPCAPGINEKYQIKKLNNCEVQSKTKYQT